MRATKFGRRPRPEAWNQWEKVIAGWKASGLGPTEYCRKNGITHSLFYRWRHRLQVRRDTMALSTVAMPQFVAVGTIQNPTTGSCERGQANGLVVIRIGKRCRIEITGGETPALLDRAINALARLS